MPSDPLADFDAEILTFLGECGIDTGQVQLSTPADRAFGERATSAAFRLAPERKQSPRDLAAEVAGSFDPSRYRFIADVEPAGAGFINFRLSYAAFVPHVIEAIRESGALYGRRPEAVKETVIVEHTSVNPNKEWHIGHLRNAVLGDVVTNVLRLRGCEVQIQNYIDDTGLQAAQAVLGWTNFREDGRNSQKFDHFLGRHYVKVASELGAEKDLEERLNIADAEERPSVEARLANIQQLKSRVMETMHSLEAGEHHDLIQQVLDAQLLTAYRLGVYYDLLNWESHLVQTGSLDEAMQQLQRSEKISRPREGRYAGAMVIETQPAADDETEPKREVLVRSNGIPTYIGKDVAYHMWKLGIIPDRLSYVEYATQPNGKTLWSTALKGQKRTQPSPDRVINVVGVHQTQAQATVKEALRSAGYPESANALVHLGYGMVASASGKMSGRQGTAVAADDVVDEAVRVAYERVKEKRTQDLTDDEMIAISEAVGVGAVRYFMVQYNPLREIVFDVGDVVSYDGNTGLYIQYALVRMSAILRKATESGVSGQMFESADPSLLQHEQEKRLAHHMAEYPGIVADTARTLSVNLVAEFAFELATIFSQFYRDCPVLNAEPALRDARLRMVKTVRDVLVNACGVLGVPVIERL